LHRDAKTPEEYRLVDGYAEDMRELVSGYQAKVANQSTPRQQRLGTKHSKRGGKVRARTLMPFAIAQIVLVRSG